LPLLNGFDEVLVDKSPIGGFAYSGVKYRSGPTIHSRVNEFLHIDGMKDHAEASREHVQQSASRTKTMAYGAAANVGDTVGQVLLPVKNALQIMPFGKIIFVPTRGEKLVHAAAEHKREKEIARLDKQCKYDEMTRRTIR
jgi:hypothetical protein